MDMYCIVNTCPYMKSHANIFMALNLKSENKNGMLSLFRKEHPMLLISNLYNELVVELNKNPFILITIYLCILDATLQFLHRD